MKRTPKMIDVDLYGAIGTGPTRSEAKAQAAAKISTAFSDHGSYSPEMTRFPQGEIGTVYRTLEGWTYGILWAEESRERHYGMGLHETRRAAEQAMRRNLAQLYCFDEATNYGHDLLHAMDDQGHSEQTRYIKFQHAYRELQAQGYSDTDCHRMACEARAYHP